MEETLLQQNEEMETIDNDCETIEDGESVETNETAVKVIAVAISALMLVGEVYCYEKIIRPTVISAKDSIKNMIENRREKARIRKEEKMENENNKQ